MESNLLCDVSKSRSFSWERMTMLMHKVKWISGHWSIPFFFPVRYFGLQIIHVNTLSIPLLQKQQVTFSAYEIWLCLDSVLSCVWKWLSAYWTCDHCGDRRCNVHFRNGSFFVSPPSVPNAQIPGAAIRHRRLAILCCLRGVLLGCYRFQGWDQMGRRHIAKLQTPINSLLEMGHPITHLLSQWMNSASRPKILLKREFTSVEGGL